MADERPTGNAPIATFRVAGARKTEATAVVLEWLYRGRPSIMTVTEVQL